MRQPDRQPLKLKPVQAIRTSPPNADRKIHNLTIAPAAIELLEQLARSQQLEVAGPLELFGEQAALLQTPLGQLIDPVRLVDCGTYSLPVLLKMSVLELLRSEVQ